MNSVKYATEDQATRSTQVRTRQSLEKVTTGTFFGVSELENQLHGLLIIVSREFRVSTFESP